MIMLLLRGAPIAARFGSRGVPLALRFVRERGFRGLRARQILRPAVTLAASTGLAAGAAVLGTAAVRVATDRNGNGGQPMPLQQPSPGRMPVRRGQIVTPGPVPVEFVKSWQACAALFAIDTQGVRWVWRPKLGIWKRIRNTRNIVISGKDIRRARRLVRISKRLNKMRTQIR